MRRTAGHLCALFLLLTLIGLKAQTLYYASDKAGFPLSLLPGLPSSPDQGPEYLLVIERSESKEIRKLLSDGRLIEVRERERRRGGGTIERVTKQGVLDSLVTYDDEGRILEEIRYAAPAGASILERLVYDYSRGRLSSVQALSPEGQIRGSLSYRYTGDGRLSETRSAGSLGAGSAGQIVNAGALRAAWSETADGSLKIERFDAQGRRISKEIRKNGRILELERYQYAPAGDLQAATYANEETGLKRESSFDKRGLPLLVIERNGAQELSRLEYHYDEKARLVREIRRQARTIEERSLSYSDDGSLAKEILRINGAKIMETFFSGTGKIEELYDEGLLFVRVHYDQDAKVLEEFIIDGKVIRSKAFR